MKKPAIIISSSGMMNAGRIRHHLYNNIENPKNTFLIVGYCSPDTAGGMLKAGVEELTIFGEVKQVKAEIKTMDSFSAHADRKEMLTFLKNQKKVKSIFLVHGEIGPQTDFKKYLGEAGFKNVIIPELGDHLDVSGKKMKKKSVAKKKNNKKIKEKSYPAKSKNRKANLEKKRKKQEEAKLASKKKKTSKSEAKAKVAAIKTKKKKAARKSFSKKKKKRGMDMTNHWKRK